MKAKRVLFTTIMALTLVQVLSIAYAQWTIGDFSIGSGWSIYAEADTGEEGSWSSTSAWYFHTSTHEVNNVTGYVVNMTAPGTLAGENVSISTVGDAGVTWAVNIYVRHTGSASALTGTQSALLLRTEVGLGVQSTTVNVSTTNLQFGFDALEVILYSRWDEGEWTTRAIYITNELFYKRLTGATLTFQAWTERSEAGGSTTASFRWGNSSYVTGLSGLTFVAGDQFDWMTYHLRNGNPFAFVFAPMVYLVGNLSYAMLGVGFLGTLYVRYKNAGVVLVLLCIFGGAGGLANLLFGDTVLGIVWLLATFGFAALFWKVFR